MAPIKFFEKSHHSIVCSDTSLLPLSLPLIDSSILYNYIVLQSCDKDNKFLYLKFDIYMGNCSQKGLSGECENNMIRILTDSGTIVQFKSPKLVKDVLVGYSGHGIFRLVGDDLGASIPLSDYEYLVAGQNYSLLPLCEEGSSKNRDLGTANVNDHQSAPCKESTAELPDSSMENVALGVGPAFQVLPTLKNGVWRVKLVINTKQLGQILSEEENTEALIEKMRVAATATNPARRSRSSWGSAWKIRPGMSNAFKASSAESC